MRIRGLLVATLVFLILGGILYWSEHHKPAEETAKASANTSPPILKLDQAAITKVEIKKKDVEPILLTKAGSGDWQISAPKALGADQSTVTGMISTLSSLNSERLIEEKAADLKTYGLDQPGVEVDVSEKDNKTQRLLIGDDTPAGSAVYAMVAGDPRIFTLASYNKSSFDKSLDDLRDKRLLTVNSDKVSRIELIRKNQDIEFGRNKDEWQILKPKPLRADSFEVGELARKLTGARMELSGSEDDKKAVGAFAQGGIIGTAKVTDESGTQELEIRKNKDNYYAKSSVVEGVYKVGTELGQALDKSLDDFRNKKLFDFGYSDPDKIELHSGAKACFVTKGGADWWGADGKKLDAGSVQELISKLRDLTASKFVDSGFTQPEIEATVVSNDGKRVEKALISKSGNGYVARRENEPALYGLDSGPVEDLQKAVEAVKPAASK
jgi:hypothetical protein